MLDRLVAGLVLLLFPSVAALAQSAPDPWRAHTVAGSFELDMVSQQTGRTHRIFLAIPDGEPPADGWPVLYIVDGNAHFAIAERMMRSVEQFARALPPQADPPVIVGIGYPDVTLLDIPARAEDLTPPTGDARETGDRLSVRHGGADRFLAFIESELKPVLAARVPTDQARETLTGHSYGGLFTLHVLFTAPDSFDTYVAGSPSIWWRERFILDEAEAFLAAPSAQTVPRLMITVGGQEQTPMPWHTDPARHERLAAARMVDNARDLAARLEQDGAGRVETDFRTFEGESHYTASLPMIVRAVELAAGYPLDVQPH